jgi:hypothetical protein
MLLSFCQWCFQWIVLICVIVLGRNGECSSAIEQPVRSLVKRKLDLASSLSILHRLLTNQSSMSRTPSETADVSKLLPIMHCTSKASCQSVVSFMWCALYTTFSWQLDIYSHIQGHCHTRSFSFLVVCYYVSFKKRHSLLNDDLAEIVDKISLLRFSLSFVMFSFFHVKQ